MWILVCLKLHARALRRHRKILSTFAFHGVACCSGMLLNERPRKGTKMSQKRPLSCPAHSVLQHALVFRNGHHGSLSLLGKRIISGLPEAVGKSATKQERRGCRHQASHLLSQRPARLLGMVDRLLAYPASTKRITTTTPAYQVFGSPVFHPHPQSFRISYCSIIATIAC